MPDERPQVYRVPLAAELLAGSRLEAYALVSAALAASNVLPTANPTPARLILGPFDLTTEGWRDEPAEAG